MERLTQMGDPRLGYHWDITAFCDMGLMEDIIIDKLGAYEDTGLTPEEIEQLKDELNHAYDKSNTAVKGYYELKQSYEQLQKENADLIELLKIMYKDLIGKCSVCVVKDGDMRECFGCNKINPKWQWQHADKLKELGVKV